MEFESYFVDPDYLPRQLLRSLPHWETLRGTERLLLISKSVHPIGHVSMGDMPDWMYRLGNEELAPHSEEMVPEEMVPLRHA